MTTLGRYEIVAPLGSGSMGTVYRARDTVLDREVALKTIRTGADVEPELRERFHREARACARLQHPSIVVVHDLGEVDHTAYIAMELLTGSDFRKLIDARKDIPLAVKIEAMAQVSEALAYAHRHGIIHRDIKPSNLFLVDNRTAKVLDFGIARLPSSKLTVAGRILGTPNYMAPEQILVQPTDGRSDLFSAAVVFFEFLVFAHPFKGDIIPRRIVEGQPDSLFDYDSKLPALLERILERALAKDPNQRYRTGDELGADLRAVLEVLRQTASTSFSRVQLPSDREIQSAAPSAPEPSEGDASCLRPTPPGEDPHEWRSSEVMRLIPEFEAAASRHDMPAARESLRQLEAIGIVDSRFVDAVQMCRSRLSELESTPAAAGIELPLPGPADSGAGRTVMEGSTRSFAGSDPGAGPKICADCGATNRSAAAYCIQCGGSLLNTIAGAKVIPSEPFGAGPGTGGIGADSGTRGPRVWDQDVQFTVYRPRAIQPDRWYPLLAFAHRAERPAGASEAEPDPIKEMVRQAEQILGAEAGRYQNLTSDSAQPIPREGEITLVPVMPGVEFNPPRRSFLWVESVHREEFGLRARGTLAGETLRGSLSVFLGSLVVAEVPLTIRVDRTAEIARRLEPASAPVYRKIFASYSHADRAVVEEFEQYARALGDRYLRDVIDLRAGEVWSERLREMIGEAHVFQLFWSTNSIHSPFVRDEWRCALSTKRANFIRPVYWEDPLPEDPASGLPPEELRALHFERVAPRKAAAAATAPPTRSRFTTGFSAAPEQPAIDAPRQESAAVPIPFPGASETPAAAPEPPRVNASFQAPDVTGSLGGARRSRTRTRLWLAAAAVLICAAAAWFFLAHRSGPVTPPPVRPPVAAGPAGGSGQTPGIGAENGGKKPGEQASEKAPRRSAPEKTRTVKGAAQKAKSQQESSASDLAKAEGLFKKGRLDDAEKLVGEVLDRENDNQKALDLRKNIEAARSLQ